MCEEGGGERSRQRSVEGSPGLSPQRDLTFQGFCTSKDIAHSAHYSLTGMLNAALGGTVKTYSTPFPIPEFGRRLEQEPALFLGLEYDVHILGCSQEVATRFDDGVYRMEQVGRLELVADITRFQEHRL